MFQPRLVKLYYDVVSPYTWLGFELLCRYRLPWQLEVTLKPILLGGVFLGSGNRLPPGQRISPAKKFHIENRDLPAQARHYGVPLLLPGPDSEEGKRVRHAMFKVGALSTMRFVTAVQMRHPDAVVPLSRQLFLRLFSSHQDVAQPSSLKEAAEAAGLSADVVAAALSDMSADSVKARLKATTEEAVALGAFGSPTFVVHTADGRQELVFGSDRFHIIGDLLGCEYLGPLKHLSQV